jgi:hypothetical protein
LGPFTAEYRVKPWSETQNQAKRINNIGYWLLLRDQRNQSVSVFVSAVYIALLGPLGSTHQRPSSASKAKQLLEDPRIEPCGESWTSSPRCIDRRVNNDTGSAAIS